MCPFVRTMTSARTFVLERQPDELLGHGGIMCRVNASNVGGIQLGHVGHCCVACIPHP